MNEILTPFSQGWCFLITSSLQPDGHIYSTLYSLINSGWRRAAYASGLMPGDYILNGHIAKSEPIQKEIMQHKREIGRKIKGVTILLDIGPIDGMLSFETFLTNHDYPRHPEYTSKSIVFWPHEEHMWARRVLVDCPHIHIDEYTILCVEKAARMCARETVAAYPNRRWTGLNNRWRIYELGPVRQYRREGSAYIKKEEDDVVIKHERRSRH
ncbi:hypothetical protein F5Y14DRAFT_370774 [Nemania sp. NC0429]|nr:hypothetical protein F5Y14DRAFT_370774 [Nemania sp. NC0429]